MPRKKRSDEITRSYACALDRPEIEFCRKNPHCTMYFCEDLDSIKNPREVRHGYHYTPT